MAPSAPDFDLLSSNMSSFSNGSVEAHLPLALTYRITNKFDELPSWNYPLYYDIYCENNHTVVGERHPFIGSLFILHYLIFLCVGTPPLIVMAHPDLLQHSCYKLMLVMGLIDHVTSFTADLMAGIFSITGMSYCDCPLFMNILGHVTHSVYYCYCITGIILAFNRYMELKSPATADRLFAGNRTWYWFSFPAIYSIILSSSLDLPLIYNSQWSVYLFQINPTGPMATNWFCVLNCGMAMLMLATLYALLLLELHNKGKNIVAGSTADASRAKLERKVRLQCFILCLVLFIVLAIYGMSNFVPLPLPAGVFATFSVQCLTTFTSLVLVIFNSTVREKVREMLFGCLTKNKVTPSGNSNLHTVNSKAFDSSRHGSFKASEQININSKQLVA